ncbi:MAG: hypothetical protein ACRD3Q_04460 [Terriglobales bacterium]
MTSGEVRDLKAVILHDSTKNEYRVLTHNFTSEEATSFIAEWNTHLIEGAQVLAIAQPKRHKTQNPEDCEACRKAVKQSSGLTPPPKFTRRKS